MGFLPCITSMLLRAPCSCRQGQLIIRHHAALHGWMVSSQQQLCVSSHPGCLEGFGWDGFRLKPVAVRQAGWWLWAECRQQRSTYGCTRQGPFMQAGDAAATALL